MLYELTPQKFPSVKSLFGKFTSYPVINAVIEGNAPGRVFVDLYTLPQSAFLLTNAGFSYLMGSPHNRKFNQALNELLNSQIFPAIQASHDPSLIFYPLTNGWEVPLKEFLDGRKTYELYRKQFTFYPEEFAKHADWQGQMPVGFSLHQIDQSLLNKVGADMFPWESPSDFLEKGLGFWIMNGDEIACECSSVFASSNAVEINIHTDEKYQRRGLARIAATAFIKESLACGLKPNWESWWDNQASISLAQTLGFEPIGDQPVFLVELN